MALVQCKFYGHLADRFSTDFEFEIDSVAEVFRALNANLPGFVTYLKQHSDPGYRVVVNGEPYTLEQMQMMVTVPSTIEIVPVVAGSTGIEEALIAAAAAAAEAASSAAAAVSSTLGISAAASAPAVATSTVGIATTTTIAGGGAPAVTFGGAAAASQGFSFAAFAGQALVSLALSGIASLLSPTPSKPKDGSTASGGVFSNVDGTIQQGLGLPLIYGRMMVTGLPVSVRMVVEEDAGWTKHTLTKLKIDAFSTATLDANHRIGVGDIRLPVPDGYFQEIVEVAVTFSGNATGWTWELVDYNLSPGPRIRVYHNDILVDTTLSAVISGHE